VKPARPPRVVARTQSPRHRAAIVVIIVVFFFVCGGAAIKPQPRKKRTWRLPFRSRRRARNDRPGSGRRRDAGAAAEATLSARLQRRSRRCRCLTNRRVRAGDVLAVLESRDLAAQRAEAAAAVTEAETTAHSTVNGTIPITNAQDSKAVRDARANLDTQKKLTNAAVAFRARPAFRKKISRRRCWPSQQGLMNDSSRCEAAASAHTPSRIRATSASHKRGSSRHAIAFRNLDAQLGYTVIRAPFDGVITAQFHIREISRRLQEARHDCRCH